MRSGFKAAGKNAVAGRAILAAIEGVSIAVNRMLMPYIQKKQMESGMEIDTLEPPLNPLNPYRKRKGVTEIWQPETSRALEAVPTKGFDIDSIPEFDASDDPYANPKHGLNSSGTGSDSNNSSAKPGWKLW